MLSKGGKQRPQNPACGQKYITSVVIRTTIENEWKKLRKVKGAKEGREELDFILWCLSQVKLME